MAVARAEALTVKRGVSRAADPETAVREIHALVHDPRAALTVVYASPDYDRDALADALRAAFGDAPVLGCTTAGEIGPDGYLEGSLTAVSVGGPSFFVETVRIDQLSELTLARGAGAAYLALDALAARLGRIPNAQDTFGFVLVDGLSVKEESLVATLYEILGPMAIFGGSAGDGTRFGSTWLYHEGRFHTDCALLTLVSPGVPFTVFRTHAFEPATAKMVVTEADVERRVVREIDGGPAADAYARHVGVARAELDPFVFASHPIVVTIGGKRFVRSVSKVDADGSMTFLSAIEEGIVLTLGRATDMTEDLARAFALVRAELGPPSLVLGCDCILRFLEAGRTGKRDELGKLLADNRVVGFATYGEQWNAMHVNQTFTAVAFGGGRRDGS